MTKDKTVTMSRELEEKLEKYLGDEWDPVQCDPLDELRAILAAPVVERQPVAWIKEHWSGKGADFHYKTLVDVVFKEDWKPLYASQPAPVSADAAKAFSKGFNTLETIDGKYKIVMQFAGHDDAWEAYTALSKMTACLDKVKELNTQPICCGSCPGGCVIQAADTDKELNQ